MATAANANANEEDVNDDAAAAASSGVLEVRYEDLQRALCEVQPTGSAATKAELAGGRESGARSLMAASTARVRAWRRERRLGALTTAVMRDEREE